MVNWGLLGIACVLAGVSLFTVVKAPTVGTWKLAVVSGEFGQVLAMVPLGVAGWVTIRGAGGAAGVYATTLGLCVVSIFLLLKPSVQARWVAAGLAGRLEKAFGRVELGRRAFSFAGIFAPGREVKAEVRVFAGEGTADALAMDFYRAERGGERAPCLIVVHGGGWDGGERGQMAWLNSTLARRGIAVAAVSYRLAPKDRWPAQKEDVEAAIVYLKKHCAELGVDAERLVLMGRSAGGQIAESVAYGAMGAAVRGVIALYAPADLFFAWSDTPERDVLDSKTLMRQLIGGTPAEAREGFTSASPYLQARRGVVPTLLMHGSLDSLVWCRQSGRLAERLTAEGVPNVFVELPWATHAFDYSPRGPGGQIGAFAIEWFVRAVGAGKEGERRKAEG